MSAKNIVKEQIETPGKGHDPVTQILLPTNLKIDLNTPTDFWVVGSNGLVGFAGILTAIVVARITRKNQLSQNRVNQATLRQKWQERFAEASARYLSIVNQIAIEAVLETNDPNERKMHVAKRLPDLLYWHEVIAVMLDLERDYAKDALKVMSELTDNLRNVNLKGLGKSRNALRKSFNQIHEKAWQDIRNDLNA